VSQKDAVSEICRYTKTDIFVRDKNLCTHLIGKTSFTEFLYYLILGVEPTAQQRMIVDAALISLAEHGLSPGATVTRLTYMGAPESMQGAVAAGLLGVGDQFVGTLELTGRLLLEMREHPEGPEQAAAQIVARYRAQKKPVPGFGQPHHVPDDPRSPALFEVAAQAGVEGSYIRALHVLGQHVDAALGRHMTINAPGAIAALFLEIGIPVQIMRGFTLICRCAGLVAHVREEQLHPLGRTLWAAAADSIDSTQT
jgi:citrate synthase